MKPGEWAKVLDAIADANPESPLGRDLKTMARKAAGAFRQVEADRDAEWRAVRETVQASERARANRSADSMISRVETE